MVASATIDWSGGASARASLVYPTHEIGYKDVLYQYMSLEYANALPADGSNYPMIISPHSAASLFNDATFVAMFVREPPESAIRTGRLGTLMNCSIYVSSNAYEVADGGANSTDDVYSALFIGKDSVGVVGIAGLDPNNPDNAGPEGGNLTGQSVKPVEIIVHNPGDAGSADALNQRGSIGWKATSDTQILNSAWIRSLEHVNVFSQD
jgi:N4-gp56 family major capsid protein